MTMFKSMQSMLRRVALFIAVMLPALTTMRAQSNDPVITGYTATDGSTGKSGQGYDKLFDNNKDTKFCVERASYVSFVFVEFQTGTPFIPTGYILTTAADIVQNPGSNPKNWVIKARMSVNDPWTTIVNVENNTVLQGVNKTDYEFSIDNLKAYRYFRFEITEMQEGLTFQLSEFKFRGVTNTYFEDVMLIGGDKNKTNELKASYQNQGWNLIDYDLNKGASGDFIYLLYKVAHDLTDPSRLITGFYISSQGGDTPDELTYNGRTYHLTPYDGGQHFKDLKGNLNSNAGGSDIHLFYTKDKPNGTFVTDVVFNDTKSGAMGAQGGSEGYDLNKGASGDFIYMHVNTEHRNQTLTGSGTASKPYIIDSDFGWSMFCHNISLGIDTDKHYKLTTDISNATTMAGNQSTPFSGTFDGDGHTINVDYKGNTVAAPFAYTANATIKNLTVSGSISATQDAGGIVGHASGTLTLNSCISQAALSGFYNLGGGLVGCCDNLTLNISDCMIKGSFTPGNGGIFHPIACKDNSATVKATVTSACYLKDNAPTATGNNLIADADGIPVSTVRINGEWDQQITAIDGQTYYAAVKKVTVGIGLDKDPDYTSIAYPLTSIYKYCLSQQIYTSQEIGTEGIINSIAFRNTDNEVSRNLSIYLLCTDKQSFESTQDWVPMNDLDLVYSGNVIFVPDDWTTITFTEPFYYDGTSNLIVGVVDNTGSSASSFVKFMAYKTTTYQDISASRNSGIFDVANPEENGSRNNAKNKIILEIIPQNPSCATPSSLTVSNLNALSATLTWTGSSNLYNVEYKKAGNEEWTRVATNTTALSFQLNGLQQNTDYLFRVQSVISDTEYSIWRIVRFTTPYNCPSPTDVMVTLTPGDGSVATLSWTENGSATQWEICLNNDEDHLIEAATNPFTLTGLTAEIVYSARVRSVNNAQSKSFWTDSPAFRPTDSFWLTVNDGTQTNNYIPVSGYYADSYSKSQFIIPSTVLTDLQYGTINRLVFYAQDMDLSWGEARHEVYMTQVNTTTFATQAFLDWTDMEKVMSAGTLSIAGQKMEVILNNPYQYKGGNLLIGFLQTQNGSYRNCYWYGVNQESNTAVSGYSNDINLNTFLPKATIYYIPGSAQDVSWPTGFKVIYTDGNSATVTWKSDETAVDIDVNGTVTNNVTSPYTLSNLQLSTTYNVKVRARRDDKYSDWTTPAVFTTDDCMPDNKIPIHYSLTDDFGDGWQGQINVVDVATGNTITTLKINGMKDADEGSFLVCDGRQIEFVWVYGNQFDYQSGFVITDQYGDIILEHQPNGENSAPVPGLLATYTVDGTVTDFRAPANLTVSQVQSHGATLGWTEKGPANEWIVAYKTNADVSFTELHAYSNSIAITGLDAQTDYTVKVRPATDQVTKWSLPVTFTTALPAPVPEQLSVSDIGPYTATASWKGLAERYDVRYAVLPQDAGLGLEPHWLKYDDGEFQYNIGTGSEFEWQWAVKYPVDSITGNKVTKIALYENSAGISGNITVSIRSGEYAATATTLYQQTVTPIDGIGFHEIILNEPVTVPTNVSLWIQVKAKGTNPMAVCRSYNPDNQWVYVPNQSLWYNIQDVFSTMSGYGWIIRAYLESDPLDESAFTWTQATVDSESCQISDLSPDTRYIAQVRGKYGVDGDSPWATALFNSNDINPAPVNITATTTVNQAQISWTGYGDSYQVIYGQSTYSDLYFYDNFEHGLDQWTVYTQGDANNDIGWNIQEYADNNNVAIAWSWYNGSPYDADNWLISPLLDVVDQCWLSYLVTANGTFIDNYEVKLSTTGKSIDDFTVTLREMSPAPSDWTKESFDLVSYAGQKVYIAIHHKQLNGSYMAVDDFRIVGYEHSGLHKTTINTTQTSVSIDNLKPGTGYQCRVKSIKDDQESYNNEWTLFSTLNAVTLTNDADNTETIVANSYKVSDVTLQGRTLYKDGTWNSLCLPFNMTAQQVSEQLAP